MEVTFGVNLTYFLWSLALGGALSLVYDLLRCGRRIAGGTSAFRINLEDVVFFLLTGVLLFVTAFDKNGGRLRWQGFLGTAMGAGLYYLLFRNRMVHALCWLYQRMMEAVIWLIRVLLFPIRVVYRILAKPFLVIGWYSRKTVSKAGGVLKTRQMARQMRRKTKQAEKLARQKRAEEEKKQKRLKQAQEEIRQKKRRKSGKVSVDK